MAYSTLPNFSVRGVSTCVPEGVVDNQSGLEGVDPATARKVSAMAGVRRRHVSDGTVTASDLCRQAGAQLLDALEWAPESVDGLILVTQSPDYFLPSSSCLVHRDLGCPESTAAFDVGLGCSGYPYGLWLGGMMLNSGLDRVVVMHGETPSLFCHPEDHGTTLLFGDAGSATALERDESGGTAAFSLHSDGAGYGDLLIRGGGFRDRHPEDSRDTYLYMDGPGIFAFSLARVPELIRETLDRAGIGPDGVDHFVLHQSNQFMMKHLAKKCGLDPAAVPIILEEFGNTGGVSVPLAMTQAIPRDRDGPKRVCAVGYGVGLSWASALFDLDPGAHLLHSIYESAASEDTP